MPPHSPLADYLTALGHELAYDPALARRVRREVEDHLCEAVMAEGPRPAAEAEQRAISRFGDPAEIAARYRAVSLYLRMRKTGATVALAIAGIYLLMKARTAWYGLVQWPVSDRLRTISETVVPIDRYAFLFGAAVGIVAWLYILTRPVPTTYRPGARDQLRRCQVLTGTAAVMIALAVGIELFLTAARLAEAECACAAWLPLGSMLAEVALIVVIAGYMRNTMRRMAACGA
jgi:hypothetical protein